MTIEVVLDPKTNTQGAVIDPKGAVAGVPAAPAGPTDAEQRAAALAAAKSEELANEAPAAKAAREAAEKAAADKVVTDKAAADKATADAAAAAPLTEYVTLDDPSGQAVINLLKEANVTPTEANAIFAKAIASGDLADVDWATLEAKVGKDKALLAKNGVESYYNNKFAVARATIAKTYEIMGGEENWGKVRTWAQTAEKTDAAVKQKIDGIRKMIDLGGYSAEAGATELKRMYEAAPGNSGLGTAKITTGDTVVSVTGGPLSRTDYMTAMHAANNAQAKAPVFEALRARRRAGMAAGI
ncbi:MAG: hypothetical protein WD185_09595 [Sneathiella sp.]